MKQTTKGDADTVNLLSSPIQDPEEGRTSTRTQCTAPVRWAKKAMLWSIVMGVGFYLTCHVPSSKDGQMYNTTSEEDVFVEDVEVSAVLHFTGVGMDGFCRAAHHGVNPNHKMCIVDRGYMTQDECFATCSGGTKGRRCGFTDEQVTACEWVEGWGCKLFRDEVSQHVVVKYPGHACWARTSAPTQPPGTDCDGTKERRGYLSGPVTVSLGHGQTGKFNLHVQIKEKHNDGRSTCKVWQDGQLFWQGVFKDYIKKGIQLAKTRKLLGGITGGRVPKESGVYMEDVHGSCGYAGAPRTIRCGIHTDDGMKGIAVHENFHGWQWMQYHTYHDNSKKLGLFFQFQDFQNQVYKMRKSKRVKMDYYTYLDYSLQNEWEWGAETFRQWMYGGRNSVWQFITENLPQYEKYWKCTFLTEQEATACRKSNLHSMVKKPNRHPLKHGLPSMHGFTDRDQMAIWNICLRTSEANKFYHHFDGLVQKAAPHLPHGAHKHYRLGFGDCNHDGYVDYLCWYTGPGPAGVGNGNYLWNEDNKHGALAFVVSGRQGDPWAFYKPDPYFKPLKALMQPMFREWQSDHGSCNGAFLADHHPGVQEAMMMEST